MTKYRIQRSVANDGQTWVQSDSYPLVYYMNHRIVEVIRKPYRRHAAITPLELRGAIAILSKAMRFAVAIPEYDTYSILYDARLQVIRELEAL